MWGLSYVPYATTAQGQASHFGVHCGLRYKKFTSWAKDVAAKPAPKNPLAKKTKRPQDKENSQQALVAAIRCGACPIVGTTATGDLHIVRTGFDDKLPLCTVTP